MKLGKGRRLVAGAVSRLADIWPDPVADKRSRYNAAPGTSAFEHAYARDQFMKHVWFGSALRRAMPTVWGQDVLEIGCGHGGISCYLASLGARRVIGIDLAADHFRWGRELAAEISGASGRALPVSFVVTDGRQLAFADGSFDLVVADNVFEHIPSPEQLMRESLRVLRPGGLLLVPNFSSIMSKYGLHLKNGLRLPWLNLFLDEATIIEALRQRADRRPELLGMYPGLAGNPQRVAEVRRHGDLNEITHAAFIELAAREGFEVTKFNVHGTRLGRWLTRLSPQLERTRVLDILSTGAAAVLRKPAERLSTGAGQA